MAKAEGDAGRRAPGRPADPEIESRVFEAVREVYTETGWAGFSVHAVATRARVGKAAIYRRWLSKEDLIVDTIMAMAAMPAVDRGSLREDLIWIVQGELQEYLTPAGLVRLRAQVEAKVYPELFGAAMERFRRLRINGGRVVITNAIARGELSETAEGIIVLDAIGGMTLNHFLATPTYAQRALKRDSRQFAESVVDFALAALASRAKNSS